MTCRPTTLLRTLVPAPRALRCPCRPVCAPLPPPICVPAGAKPILKSGDKWPCLTVHYLPSLQPAATFTGAAALDHLHRLLREQAAPPVAVSSRAPVQPAAAAAAAPAAGPPAPPSQLVVLRKGAAQAKELLAAGKAAGTAVVVVWTRSSDGGDAASVSAAALRAAAAEAAIVSPGLALVDADAGASASNQLLATALKVKGFPEVHVYRDMQLASKLSGADATPARLASLVVQLVGGRGSGGVAAAAEAPATATPAAAAAAPAPGLYDPPGGKFAKPGAAKRFPDGRMGYFFPKMPCLK